MSGLRSSYDWRMRPDNTGKYLDFDLNSDTGAVLTWDVSLGKLVFSGTNPMFALGSQANTAGSGMTLSATNAGALRVFSDDGGASIADSVRGVQSRVLLTYDQAGGTIRALQGQLKLNTLIDVTTGIYTGVQGYVELAGTHISKTGATFSAVDSSTEIGTSLTIDSGGEYFGVHVETTGSGTITNNGTCAAVGITKASGAADWPVGLFVDDAVTTGVQIAACTTGLLVSGNTTTGISITGNATDGIKIATGTITDAIEIAAGTNGVNISGAVTKGVIIAGNATDGVYISGGTVVDAVEIGACTNALNVSGAVTKGLLIAGNATDGVYISGGTVVDAIEVGACTNALNVSGAVTKGVCIAGNATDALYVSGGTVVDALHIGACTNGINIAGLAVTGIYMPVGSVTTAVRIGNWVGSGASGSAIPFAAGQDVYTDGQLDLVAVFGESTSDLTTAYSAKCGRFRHIATGSSLTVSQETYGLIGQMCAKGTTLTHLHAGLMGTFEGTGAAVVLNSSYTTGGHAAVTARVGGHTNITATTPLSGFLAFNNGAANLASGTLAAFSTSVASATYKWTHGLYFPADTVTRGVQVGDLGSNTTSGITLGGATSINGFYCDDGGADQTTSTVWRNVTARTYYSVDQTAAAADAYVIRGHLKAASGVDFGGDTSVKAALNGYSEFAGATIIGSGSFFASVFGEIWADGDVTGTGKIAGVMSRIYTSTGTVSGTTSAFMATKQWASTQDWCYGLYLDSTPSVADIRFSNGLVLYCPTTEVTANTTATSLTAGSLCKTSHATGRASLFVSDGSKWQFLTNS